MRVLIASFAACIAVSGVFRDAHAGDVERIPLHVLYLSRAHAQERTDAFSQFLAEKFESCATVRRDEFDRTHLAGVDVVVLDWSQEERQDRKYESPLGPIESWETPMVLLGSAGLLLAGPWSVIGGAG